MASFSVRFWDGEAHRAELHGSVELAIEAACGLIASGCVVDCIDRGAPAYPIGREAIIHIYKIWARERSWRHGRHAAAAPGRNGG